MRPCPWYYSLPLFIFRQSVNVKQQACEIIQRQWTRGMVTNLCHWHCDLCRQLVTHEPGDLCDITEKNIAGDQRWDSSALRNSAPTEWEGFLVPKDVPNTDTICSSETGKVRPGRARWNHFCQVVSGLSCNITIRFLFSGQCLWLAVNARSRQHESIKLTLRQRR